MVAIAGGFLVAAFVATAPVLAQAPADRVVGLAVSPLEGTVGDPLDAVLTLEIPRGIRLEPPEIGGTLGPFTVLSGSWSEPPAGEGAARWIWSGRIAAYEPGELEIPPVEIGIPGPEGTQTVRTEPVRVTIRSVLPSEKGGEPPPDLGDLKPPASIPPDYGPVVRALAWVAALLAFSSLAWWLNRRYAARFAAVPAPEDPFRRMPPHVWAYGELQRLLDRRIADGEEVDRFFEELGRILKTYLGGRYRVDLLEHTTEEIVPLLRQAGAPPGAASEARALLARCDLVKFARQVPAPQECRSAVEEAYRLVDLTKPVEVAAEPLPAERGAA